MAQAAAQFALQGLLAAAPYLPAVAEGLREGKSILTSLGVLGADSADRSAAKGHSGHASNLIYTADGPINPTNYFGKSAATLKRKVNQLYHVDQSQINDLTADVDVSGANPYGKTSPEKYARGMLQHADGVSSGVNNTMAGTRKKIVDAANKAGTVQGNLAKALADKIGKSTDTHIKKKLDGMEAMELSGAPSKNDILNKGHREQQIVLPDTEHGDVNPDAAGPKENSHADRISKEMAEVQRIYEASRSYDAQIDAANEASYTGQ